MSKPMIMILLEDLAQGGAHAIGEATDLHDASIQVALDEIQLINDGAGGGGVHSRIERGRIFAGMANLGEVGDDRSVSAVIGDMLEFLNSEGGHVSQALLDGYADFINEQ